MNKKKVILALVLPAISLTAVYGAAGRAEDGFLFFIVLLVFLGMVLGIMELVHLLSSRLRKYLDEMLEGLLP